MREGLLKTAADRHEHLVKEAFVGRTVWNGLKFVAKRPGAALTAAFVVPEAASAAKKGFGQNFTHGSAVRAGGMNL